MECPSWGGDYWALRTMPEFRGLMGTVSMFSGIVGILFYLAYKIPTFCVGDFVIRKKCPALPGIVIFNDSGQYR